MRSQLLPLLPLSSSFLPSLFSATPLYAAAQSRGTPIDRVYKPLVSIWACGLRPPLQLRDNYSSVCVDVGITERSYFHGDQLQALNKSSLTFFIAGCFSSQDTKEDIQYDAHGIAV